MSLSIITLIISYSKIFLAHVYPIILKKMGNKNGRESDEDEGFEGSIRK
jgi:hypothetical protein